MQMNTIVKGAVGAMLFGGTLGMTGAAAAGLTWTNVFSAMYVGLPGVYAYAGGATNSSGGSWLTQSAATSNLYASVTQAAPQTFASGDSIAALYFLPI